MSIETVGSLQSILKGHQSSGWSKSANVNNLEKLDTKHLWGDLEKVQDKKESFSEILAGSLDKVNKLQVEADVAMQKLATGQTKNIHETMLAVEKAEIAFKTMNQLRMKVIDAYKEIMRMQI